MRIVSRYLIAGLICCGTALQAVESPAETADFALSADAARLDALDLGQVVSDENLERYTGREDTRIDQLNMQVTDVTNDARMEGNVLSAIGSTINNGANTIGQGSFANASGMVTVIQNSGNQVQIQNDMVLNLFVN